jgi:trehalose 6-phosphate synthase
MRQCVKELKEMNFNKHGKNLQNHFSVDNVRTLIVANRGPLGVTRRSEPHLTSGGLASVFLSLAWHRSLTWISVDEPTSLDRINEGISLAGMVLPGTEIAMRSVAVPKVAYEQYYTVISNKALWFVHHYLLLLDSFRGFGTSHQRAWREGYRYVNQAVANAVVTEAAALAASGQPVAVLLQDYHLYLAGGFIRSMLEDVSLLHYIHVPWPEPRYWRLFPQDELQQILHSLLQNDVVGFQTKVDAQNFVSCCVEFLPGARLSIAPSGYCLMRHDRQTLVRSYPVPIEPSHIRLLAQEADALALTSLCHPAMRMILRVDRIEPTKNLLCGLYAFALLLKRWPEWIGAVCLVMLLTPGRPYIARYRKYASMVDQLAREINLRYPASEPPVRVLYGHNRAQALAAMRRFDVLLANSIFDGMNLVAQESALVNGRNGVLVLSRTTGVYQELGDAACIAITPTDVVETAEALFTALTMSRDDRERLAAEARRHLEGRTITGWITEQLTDLASMSVLFP